MQQQRNPVPPLVERLADWASRRPEHPAVVDGERVLSYRELWQASSAAARRLRDSGVGAGDRVLLAATSSLDFVVAYLGTHVACATAVPITPKLSVEQLTATLGLIRPKLLGHSAGQRTGGLACPTVALSELASGTPSSDGGGPPRLPSLDDVGDILLTSGTTGQPKGTLLTHRNIAAAARNINAFVGNDESDTEVLALPLNHSFGLGRMRCQLFAGGTLVLVPGFMFPNRLFEALATWRATGFSFVPGAWALLHRLTGTELAKFSDRLRYVEIGSAPMPLADKRLLIELLPTTRICMHYGLTEGSRSAFIEFHESADRLESIGRASPNVSLAVADDAGGLLAPGDVGTIVVQGEHVSPGSWSADGASMREGQWLSTGDVGQIDADGYVYLLGRAGDIINVGGHKVAPVEVEDVLTDHPAVREAACIGVPDPQALVGSRVKAFLVPAAGHADPPSNDELENFVRVRLEPHKIPVAYEWIAEIPKNELGKPRRHLLREQHTAQHHG